MSACGKAQYVADFHHYVIDGRLFRSIKAAFVYAKRMGYVGSQMTMARQLRLGKNTLAEISEAYVPAQSRPGGCRKRWDSSRQECAAAAAALDARKRVIDAARRAADSSIEDEA